MAVFWQRGYEGASMAALTEAMGINPPSLYACFGSKEGLFRAVLERYDARRTEFMAAITGAPTAAAVAEAFLMGCAAFCADTGGKNPPGCLALQGGLSCGETTIPEMLAKHRAEKEATLRARFERALAEGDLGPGSDPAALARYLMVMSNGIAVQASAGATAEELREVAIIALAGWPAKVAATSQVNQVKETAGEPA